MTDVKNGLKWLFWIFKENPNYTQMSVRWGIFWVQNHCFRTFLKFIHQLFPKLCLKTGIKNPAKEGCASLPPHIISVKLKSRSMLNHGSVGASLKQIKNKPTEI